MRVRMEDSSTWPLGWVLPLAERTDKIFPEVGVLLAGRGPVVFRGVCVCEPDLAGQLARAEREAFFTFAELAEKYRVD